MPACKKCKDPATKDGLCDRHFRLKQQEDQKQATQKLQMEKQAAAAKAKEAEVLAKAKKNEEMKAGKEKRAKELATTWNAKVKGIATEVLQLRRDNPKRTGINAGKNAGLETTDGGTDNPLKFAVPSPNPFGVTTADVFAKMTGFDSSDSGGAKFRVDGVLIHCH